MSERSPEQDPDELIRRMYEPRGYLHEWHVYMAERAPDYLAAWEAFTRSAGAGSQLPKRYRELVYVGVLAAIGEEAVAKNHMHAALDAGACEQDLMDAVVAAANPTGAITMCHGIKALVEVLHERGLYDYRDVPYRVTDRPAHAERTYVDDKPDAPQPG